MPSTIKILMMFGVRLESLSYTKRDVNVNIESASRLNVVDCDKRNAGGKTAQTDGTSTPTTANEQTLGKFSDLELTTRGKKSKKFGAKQRMFLCGERRCDLPTPLTLKWENYPCQAKIIGGNVRVMAQRKRFAGKNLHLKTFCKILISVKIFWRWSAIGNSRSKCRREWTKDVCSDLDKHMCSNIRHHVRLCRITW